MADPLSDFSTVGEYRPSGRSNLGLALSLLLFGLAAGAIAALLYAPKTGKQMRRTLRRKYQDALETVDDWGEQASDLIDRGSEWTEKAKSKVKPIKKVWNG